MKNYKGWEGFIPGKWCDDEVNVRDFIQKNYTPYEGDDSFLAPATEATKELWKEVMELSAKERANNGVLDADTKVVSTLTSHGPGYINKDLQILAEFIKTLNNVEKIEVLPYHTMGVVKYQNMGIEYPLKDVKAPTKNRVLNAKKILGVI